MFCVYMKAINVCIFIFFTFYFVLEYSQLTMLVIVTGGQQRDSAIHIHVSFLPQTPLPSRLTHNIQQDSLCYTVIHFNKEVYVSTHSLNFFALAFSRYTNILSQIFLFSLFITFFSFLLHAAAAAKSLQSCPTLCDPIDGSPPGSPVPGILQARTLEEGRKYQITALINGSEILCLLPHLEIFCPCLNLILALGWDILMILSAFNKKASDVK